MVYCPNTINIANAKVTGLANIFSDMVLKVKYAIEGDTNVPGVYLDGRITEPSLCGTGGSCLNWDQHRN